MATNHLVSVIIPIYNAEIFLEKCLDSVLGQTYSNIEIICINDGSTDKTTSILDEYSFRDKRINIFTIDNAGVSNARNIGINNSNGKYIFFLDADDYLELNAIELLINNKIKVSIDLVVGNFTKINGTNKVTSGHENRFSQDTLMDKEQISEYIKIYLETSYKDLLFNHCWGKLYNASIIKNNKILFDTNLHGFEDIDFNFRILKYINYIYYNKSIIYNYLLSNNSQSSKISLNIEQINKFIIVFDNIKKTLLQRNSKVQFNIEQEVGHFYISNMIMILIRTCGQMDNVNAQQVIDVVGTIINNKDIIYNLQYYKPKDKETWLMPYLIKIRILNLIILFGKYKYYKHRINGFLNLMKEVFR